MKKEYLIGLLLAIVAIFSFNIDLRAENDTITCTYIYEAGGKSREELTFSFYVDELSNYVTYFNSNKLVALDLISGNPLIDSYDNYFYNGYYYFLEHKDNIKTINDSKCPAVYIEQGTTKISLDFEKSKFSHISGGTIDTRKICIGDGNCGTMERMTVKGEEAKGDVTNTDKSKIYKKAILAGEAFGLNYNDSTYDHYINITITAYNTNLTNKSLYVQIDDGQGAYLSDTIINNRYNSVYEATLSYYPFNKIIIQSDSFKDFTYNYPYVSETSNYVPSGTLKLKKIANKVYSLYVSYDENDEGVEVQNDSELQSEIENHNAKYHWNVSIDPYNSNRDTVCNMLGGADSSLVDILKNIFLVIKVVSVILLIVFAMLDMSKVITNDKEDVMKAARKWVSRLIMLIIILLLPTLIEMIGSLIGYDNILCGIK